MYPAIFHLSRIIEAKKNLTTICDVGGSAGQHFYQFRSYLPAERIASWTVIDLPKITAFGAHVASERGAVSLRFSTDIRAAEGCDVLYSAGAFQFIGDPFFASLAALSAKPRHVLLNKIEIASDGSTFHAIQWQRHQGGYVVSTYGFDDLLSRMDQLGYGLTDHWRIGDSGHHPIFRGLS